MKYTDHQAFTFEYPGLTNVIRTPIGISQVGETDSGKIIKADAIWDTGATNCAITKSFASQLDLLPIWAKENSPTCSNIN